MSENSRDPREPSRLVKCPTCGKQTKFTPGNPFRPFCSDRCRWIDLGSWAEGRYAIPVKPSTHDEGAIVVDPEADRPDEDG